MSDPRAQVVRPFLEAVEAAVPEASAVLHGSLARGDFVEGLSDVNLLVVAHDLGAEALDRLRPAVRRWREAGYPPPLLFPRQEWAVAIDVFQVELADMLSAYEVLLGTDPLAGLQPQPSWLRRALESDFRGKLMRLRQAYATVGDDAGRLGVVAIASSGTVLVLLRGLLALHRAAVPRAAADLIAAAEVQVGASLASVAEVAGHRGSPPWMCPPELFLSYLAAVEAAATHVDRFDPLAGETR